MPTTGRDAAHRPSQWRGWDKARITGVISDREVKHPLSDWSPVHRLSNISVFAENQTGDMFNKTWALTEWRDTAAVIGDSQKGSDGPGPLKKGTVGQRCCHFHPLQQCLHDCGHPLLSLSRQRHSCGGEVTAVRPTDSTDSSKSRQSTGLQTRTFHLSELD